MTEYSTDGTTIIHYIGNDAVLSWVTFTAATADDADAPIPQMVLLIRLVTLL